MATVPHSHAPLSPHSPPPKPAACPQWPTSGPAPGQGETAPWEDSWSFPQQNGGGRGGRAGGCFPGRTHAPCPGAGAGESTRASTRPLLPGQAGVGRGAGSQGSGSSPEGPSAQRQKRNAVYSPRERSSAKGNEHRSPSAGHHAHAQWRGLLASFTCAAARTCWASFAARSGAGSVGHHLRS